MVSARMRSSPRQCSFTSPIRELRRAKRRRRSSGRRWIWLLEAEGKRCNLPNIHQVDYDNDLTCLIADEVLGLAIAKYVGGYKGLFDYVRYDKAKPGILSRLGPFMDDVVAGLIGGVSANMYTRAGVLSERSLH